MTSQRHEGLRNEQLLKLLDKALSSRDRDLFDALVRASVAQGPRGAGELARAFGEEIIARPRASTVPLLTEMAESDADAQSLEIFLPIAAAYGLAACAFGKHDVKNAWRVLRELVDDERAAVRIAVADAIGIGLVRLSDADVFLREAESWMDEYFPAAVALETLTQKSVLAVIRDPEALVALLETAVQKIESSPRAHERQASWRRLYDVLPQAIAVAAQALKPVHAWFVARAETRNADLRKTFEKTLDRLRARGEKTESLMQIAGALDSSAKPRRDPNSDFGPSRRRSKKARGRAR